MTITSEEYAEVYIVFESGVARLIIEYLHSDTAIVEYDPNTILLVLATALMWRNANGDTHVFPVEEVEKLIKWSHSNRKEPLIAIENINEGWEE